MLYLLAFVLPPLAVLLCGKPIQAVLNLFLTLLYFPGVIHALLVVSSHHADQRQNRLIRATRDETRRQTKELEDDARRRAEAVRRAAQQEATR